MLYCIKINANIMPIPQLKLKKTWEQKPAHQTIAKKLWNNRQRIIAILVIFGAFFSIIALSMIIWISRDLPNPNPW